MRGRSPHLVLLVGSLLRTSHAHPLPAWEVHVETLRLCLVGGQGNIASVLPSDPDLDLAWMTWCSAAKEGSISACKAAGGPFTHCRRSVFRT